MSAQSKPIVVRLPGDLATRFDALCAEYRGLQKSVVLRMLLTAVLEKPIAEQTQIVDAVIKGKQGDRTPPRSTLNRLSKG